MYDLYLYAISYSITSYNGNTNSIILQGYEIQIKLFI